MPGNRELQPVAIYCRKNNGLRTGAGRLPLFAYLCHSAVAEPVSPKARRSPRRARAAAERIAAKWRAPDLRIIAHPDAGKTTSRKSCCCSPAPSSSRDGKGAQSRAMRLRLDGNREAARHFGGEFRDAVRVRRGQPARHPGHQDFSRTPTRAHGGDSP